MDRVFDLSGHSGLAKLKNWPWTRKARLSVSPLDVLS